MSQVPSTDGRIHVRGFSDRSAPLDLAISSKYLNNQHGRTLQATPDSSKQVVPKPVGDVSEGSRLLFNWLKDA